IDELQSIVQQITKSSNELKAIEDILLQQSTKSLREICGFLAVESPILQLIPNTIKCEHYVSLNIYLIQLRSILQERTINIQERERKILSEDFDLESDSSLNTRIKSCYRSLLQCITRHGIDSKDKKTPERSSPSTELDIPPPSPEKTLPSSFDEELDSVDKSAASPAITEEIKFKYRPLFKLNIQFVPLISSELINKIYDRERLVVSTLPTNVQQFSIKYPDGKQSLHMCKHENLYIYLSKLFDRKRYDHKSFSIIDQNQITIDFLSKKSQLTQQISSEYSIIEKTHLVDLQFQFRTNLLKYSTTSSCDILSIIYRFIDDNRVQMAPPDASLCFFDELGKCLNTDTSVGSIYRVGNNPMVNIVVKESNNTNSLCEITLQLNKDQQYTSLFCPATTWQQINRWIQTLVKGPIDDFVFWDRKEKIVIDQNEPLQLAKDQALFDGINQKETVQVIISFEEKNQTICTLKSTPVYHLLNNERFLRNVGLKILPNSYVLIFGGENYRILRQNDMQNPVVCYLSIDDQPICFQLSVLMTILIYDDQSLLERPIPNKNLTAKQLLEKTELPTNIYKYLASKETHKVISNDQNLSTLDEVYFIVAKEKETCLVEIEKNQVQLSNIQMPERYLMSATIDHVCKQNNIDKNHQYLLYSNDFVPSIDTLLKSFRSAKLHFKLIDNNLPVTIIISDGDEQSAIFYCSSSINVKRLQQIACQLFGFNDLYYELTYLEYELDDDLSLDDLDLSQTKFELKLTCKAMLKCSITYCNQTAMLPCSEQTLFSTIMEEVCQIFHILEDCYHMYELLLINEDQILIDLDVAIGDIVSLFPAGTKVIPLNLRETE
ncbi:unnamed protein product, partial [Rotaria socialis]